MNGLEHPNLVMLKGMCLDSKTHDMLMITEYVPLGDLYHYIHNPANHMSWAFKLRIATDIALGMDFLHNAIPPIIHNDLKSPNILIVSDDVQADIVAKVADFGIILYSSSIAISLILLFSSFITGLSSRTVHNLRGRAVHNPSWLAPEVMVHGTEYTEKADVYSYAIILWYCQQ